MKINFISYLNPFKYTGGGEVVNRQLIEEGVTRGHKFKFTSAKNRMSDYNETADIDFLVDIFNFPETLKSRGAWIHLDEILIQNIVNSRPFVHMTNAYADVCNLGYLPCSGNAKSICAHKSPLQIKRNFAAKDFQRNCFSKNELVRDTYINSIANIYVSPKHRDVTNQILDLDDSSKSIVVKPIIDTSNFYNRNLTRDIEYLFVGVVSEAKGYENLKREYFHKNLVIVGDIHPGVKLDFGDYRGKLPYSQIPDIMNRAKNFVYLPRWPEPQGRVVVEAALSGCNLIVNDNVGAMSFPFDISDPHNIQCSAALFWDELEGKVK